MITLNTIPHLRVNRQKIYLPRDQKSSSMYNIIFSNNKTFNDTMKLMNHPKLITNSKYLDYYIDSKYKMKIGVKNINVNYMTRRNDMYKTIKDDFSMYRTPIGIEQLKNRNVYFDLHIYNEIFNTHSKTMPIHKRIENYFAYLKAIINDNRFNSYKVKMVCIDAESWMNNSDKINNPISYLLIAFRKYFDIFKSLGNIDFYIYSNDLIMRMNPSLCSQIDLGTFKRELQKIVKTFDVSNDEIVDKEIEKQEVKDNINKDMSDKFGFTANTGLMIDNPDDIEIEVDPEEDNQNDDSTDSELNQIVNKKIEDKIDEVIDDEPELSPEEIESKLTKKLDEDKELISFIHDTIQEKKTGKSTSSLQRDKELREKQKKIKIDNTTLEDLTSINTKDFEIPTLDIGNKVVSTNTNVNKVKFTNFEKTYNDKVMKKDTLNIISALNEKSIPTYIKDIKIEDSSDELNYKDTYHITLEDENRIRHNLTFDVPKFIDDKFLYLNGSKKIITKQLFMKPIVKTGPEEVQVCSNYNKIFINRYGANMSPKIERFKKAMSSNIPGVIIKNGDASKINTKYKTTLEYDELSKHYISIKSGKVEFIFDQDIVTSRLTKPLTSDKMCIGFNNNEPMIMNFSDEKINGIDFIDYIVETLGDKASSTYENTEVSTKKFFFSRATIMSKHVPLIILLGYCEGLTTVLKKANIQHYFTDKRPKLTNNQNYIQFNDGYLVYEVYPLENSLLLNGLSSIPTRSFDYSDMDSKEIYLDLFGAMYNARNLANAFDSFYEFMIDPITKEVLDDLDYPTDFVSVMIFANTLLADNSYIIENNMNLYRVRSNEIVNAIIHRELADAYAVYRNTAGSKNPTKISIPKDAIIKKLLTVNTVEEFSTLNPIYESEKLRTISPKGVNGMNLEKAYTLDKRSYDPTMKGIIGMSTSPKIALGGNVEIHYTKIP